MYKINTTRKAGWLVIDRDISDIKATQVSAFKTDEAFMKAVGAEDLLTAIHLFRNTIQKENKVPVILEHHEFIKWDLRYWDNHLDILLNAEELGWITRRHSKDI